ncbi:hypothetical protein [Spirosoma gilvum]
MNVKQYLINFTSIVKWDIDKLIDVARAGEIAQAQQSNSGQYVTGTVTAANLTTPPTGALYFGASGAAGSGAGIGSTSSGNGVQSIISSSASLQEVTNSNVSAGAGSGVGSGLPYQPLVGNTFLEQHTPSAAKCAVPMAMSLMATAEFLGALLDDPAVWRARNKFDCAIEEFFKYAAFQIVDEEKALLRQSFRNGMAHNFMMQGVDVAIDFQSRFNNINYLFFVENSQVILNVNKLQKIVYDVMDRLPNDQSKYTIIEDSLREYETGQIAQKTAQIVNDFKSYATTRP